MALPNESGPRELEASLRIISPMRVALAFRQAADSIGSWSPAQLDRLVRACLVHDVTAPVRASSKAKALQDLHRDAWNAAIDRVIDTLRKFGQLDGGTEKLILELKSTAPKAVRP